VPGVSDRLPRGTVQKISQRIDLRSDERVLLDAPGQARAHRVFENVSRRDVHGFIVTQNAVIVNEAVRENLKLMITGRSRNLRKGEQRGLT